MKVIKMMFVLVLQHHSSPAVQERKEERLKQKTTGLRSGHSSLTVPPHRDGEYNKTAFPETGMGNC